MIEMIVFDMAGTTVDEQNIVYKTLHKAIEKAGYDTPLETVLRFGAGKEKQRAIHDVLEYVEGGSVHKDTVAEIYQDFNKMLDLAYQQCVPQAMPGAEKVFQTLRDQGVKVVLNTGYNRTIAEQLVQKLDWQEGRTFDCLVTASDVPRCRPEPDMIYWAMDRMGIRNALSIVKVGDSTVDIEEGTNAGCGMSIGITTGAQTADILQTAHPAHIIHSLEELLTVLH